MSPTTTDETLAMILKWLPRGSIWVSSKWWEEEEEGEEEAIVENSRAEVEVNFKRKSQEIGRETHS